jgi:hypothetical protein
MIRRGELPALNLAKHRCGKPRYVILPQHLVEFERSRRAAAAPAPKRKRLKQMDEVDYFPD